MKFWAKGSSRLFRRKRETRLEQQVTETEELPALPGASGELPRPARQAPAQTRVIKRQRPVGGGSSSDELAIRWFTPRGRQARVELLQDLRYADGEHLAEVLADLRREGVSESRVDLRGIDLRGEDLGGARLRQADLRFARLDGALLAAADLSGADLTCASLKGANLKGACLKAARLEEADLSQADLSEANLESATVQGSRLAGTLMRRTWAKGVDFGKARLRDVDLGTVRTQVYRPKPPTTRRHQVLGAPPASEPRRVTERQRSAIRPPSKPASHSSNRPMLTSHKGSRSPRTLRLSRGSFEEALAEILLQRDRVDLIRVTIDGYEYAIYEAGSERGQRVA